MTEAETWAQGVLALTFKCWLAPNETVQPLLRTKIALPLLDTRMEEPSDTGVPLLARETTFLPLTLTAPLTPWSEPMASCAFAMSALEESAKNKANFFTDHSFC
ncbi:hypothetical protein Ajs_3040 [Acidovorax sp. JS42]|nr:hypothetical protein Ajs_3040 [Acidovorax sp. JS42]